MRRCFAVNERAFSKAAEAVISLLLALLIGVDVVDHVAGAGAGTYDDQRHRVSSGRNGRIGHGADFLAVVPNGGGRRGSGGQPGCDDRTRRSI